MANVSIATPIFVFNDFVKPIIKPDATVYWYAGNQCHSSKAGHVGCPTEMLAPLNGFETQNYVGSAQLGHPVGKHSPWRATFT